MEKCKHCGAEVRVQIQKNTGFCCPDHEVAWRQSCNSIDVDSCAVHGATTW